MPTALDGLAAWLPEAPRAVERARHALAHLEARGALSSRVSRLAPGGAPLELVTAPASSEVRFTSEVAPPSLLPGRRLARARRLADELVDRAPSPGGVAQNALVARRLADLARLQEGGELHFGAWLSGRFSAHATRLKIYAEVPARAARTTLEEGVWAAFGPPLATAQLRLVGIELGRGGTELYWRLPGLDGAAVAGLAEGCGIDPGGLLDLLRELTDDEVAGCRWPSVTGVGRRVGEPGLSLFFPTSRLLGPDARARRLLLRLAERRGWSWPVYERLSWPLRHATGRPCHHNLLTVTASPAGVSLRVGLRLCDQ